MLRIEIKEKRDGNYGAKTTTRKTNTAEVLYAMAIIYEMAIINDSEVAKDEKEFFDTIKELQKSIHEQNLKDGMYK